MREREKEQTEIFFNHSMRNAILMSGPFPSPHFKLSVAITNNGSGSIPLRIESSSDFKAAENVISVDMHKHTHSCMHTHIFTFILKVPGGTRNLILKVIQFSRS
jgi:hypothetical protein